MNVDTSYLCPFQHGETFVTEDGAETDLDLGHYERFIDVDVNKYSNITSGRIYFNVLTKERAGGYNGKTVQIIPHVTNEIKEFIITSAKSFNADIMIVEVGGTTGDIEGQPFLEAIRQIQLDIGRQNCLSLHVTLVPFLNFAGEHKSKPTQHSVKELQSLGISPDIIIARSDVSIPKEIKEKIALFCNVRKDCVIENLTLDCLYEAPIMLKDNGLDAVVCRLLDLRTKFPDISFWEKMVATVKNSKDIVKLALIGKYVKLRDAYISVYEALRHAGYNQKHHVEIKWIDSETLNDSNAASALSDCNGIILPDEVGTGGVEGNIAACKYARLHNLPFFGIALGMYASVIEYLQNMCGIADVGTKSTEPIGKHPLKIKPNSALMKSYGSDWVTERYRGRYDFNTVSRDALEKAGMSVSGMSLDHSQIEAVEITPNAFYLGVQYHPEFKSRPITPHPLFVEFVKAVINDKTKRNNN
jgi:CTP synthase